MVKSGQVLLLLKMIITERVHHLMEELMQLLILQNVKKIPGYVEFVVKNQTTKYDIKAPEGKVSVIDPANVTAEEFEKIKEKVKIEYSQTNDDANLTSKRGQTVDNQATRISTITKMLMEILLLHIKMVQRIQNLYQSSQV